MSNNIKKSLVILSAALICVAGSAFAYTTPNGKSGSEIMVHHPNAPENIKAHSNSPAVQNAKQAHPGATIQGARNNPTGAKNKALTAKGSPKGQETIRNYQLNNDLRNHH